MMNTLEVHKNRLEREVSEAKARIASLKKSDYPDLKVLAELGDAVERNLQLISMINAHLGCSFQPMWRAK